VQSAPLGRRIAIYGGGGKTSLADAIARKLGIRHVSIVFHTPCFPANFICEGKRGIQHNRGLPVPTSEYGGNMEGVW